MQLLVRAVRAGVYIHFPWCLSKCPYCDFVSYAEEPSRIDHAAYADAVVAELSARAGLVEDAEIASIFFGGGTPSLWEPRELGRVLAAVRGRLHTTADLEVTVECNPTSFDAERAKALVDVGVNRVSIGTQALRQDQLTYLGRRHDPDGARRAVEAALALVPRVSTDLIFGLPGQTPEDAREQADQLAGLGLRHLSCYQLTIEPRTRFGELARIGRLPLADEGDVAQAFLAIDVALEARGLSHYEISNYAAPGEEARHNLGYWRGEDYLGLGCGAYGTAGGERYRNPTDPRRYMQTARDAASESVEPLDAETRLKERIMLGLRLASGFDLEAAAGPLGIGPWTKERTRTIEQLTARGRLVREGARLRIPRDAWLFADDTAARLF